MSFLTVFQISKCWVVQRNRVTTIINNTSIYWRIFWLFFFRKFVLWRSSKQRTLDKTNKFPQSLGALLDLFNESCLAGPSLLSLPYKMFVTSRSVDETSVTTQMKATEQYFHLVLFYAAKVAINAKSVYGNLICVCFFIFQYLAK